MRRKTGKKPKYVSKSIHPCDRKTVKQRDIRKQMSKGNVYAPNNVIPAGLGRAWGGFDCLCWPWGRAFD